MKKISSLAVLLLFTFQAMYAQFSGSGSGTESDPYKIFYADQLNQVRNFTNQTGVVFKLMNDLNLSDWLTTNYPDQGWQPIGSTSEPFKGVFDGNGKTISGFNITRTSTDYVGLFAAVDGANIKNFTLKGDIKGKAYVGSLIGSGSATVTNYTFEGTVTGTNDYVGGVGGNQGTASSTLTVNATVNGASYTGGIYGAGKGLTSASFTGQVTGTSYVGGLEGQSSGTLTSCTVNAPVKGTSEYIGGLVGFASSTITIMNSNQQGNVMGLNYTGGIVGKTGASVSASNCKHEGNVDGRENTGGIIGSGYETLTLTSCYAKGDITGTTSVGGICGMIESLGSSSINACNLWGNISGTSQLGGIVGQIKMSTNTSNIDNTEFEATTIAGYKYYASSKYSYSNTACFYNTENPELLANSSGGYIVSSSSIATDINEWRIGFHSVTAGGSSTFYDTAIYSVHNNIKTKITSKINIFNCSAVGNINGTGAYIGGIIGEDIINNYDYDYYLSKSKTVYYFSGKNVNTSTTALTLREYTSYSTTSDISESYFSGNLTGTNYIGGIAGNKQGGCINKCYASGSISGGQYVGGIAGYLAKESLDTNENSMNANVSISTTITGTSNVGKIYGAKDNNFSVAALGTTSENRSVASMQLVINGVSQTINDDLQNGTAVGISQLRYKANYVAWGWDFNTNWMIQETETFPYKIWQAAPPTISSNLVSGSTSISGKSVDGGTIYIKIGKGEEQSVACTGTSFTLSGIEPLKSGELVTLYALTSGKEASYISQYTVGYPGSGTEADPWRVYSAEDIQGVYKAGYYKQMNDIDLTSWITDNSATEGWVSVGYSGSGTIVYDGDNHKVTGLWTNTTDSLKGLFSSISSGTIKNLTLQLNAKKVKGGDYTGALIGRMYAGSIENVTVTGNVQGSNYVGGIAGYTVNCKLSQLSYSGQVTASGGAGGITANASTQPITNCEVTGSTIKSTGGNVGGLVANGNVSVSLCKVTGTTVSQTGTGSGIYVAGLTANVSGTVTQCLADAIVLNSSADGYTAGLAAKSSSTIKECSATGSVTSTGSNSKTGGLVGETASGSTIMDCYSTANVSGTQYTAGLVGYNYGKVNRCYASGDVASTYYGSGLVGYNDGAAAVVTNCVALGSKVEVSDQTGWGIRVIGGYTNGAPDPDESNYAWSGMQISVNGVPKTIQDNILDGQSLNSNEIKLRDSYEALYWDFDEVWAMPADSYPVLKWQAGAEEPDVKKGDLNGDGRVSITDIVMIIDVIAGTITNANQVAAADVNGDGKVSITDCVAAIDLIAAQVSSPSPAKRKAHVMVSSTDFICATIQDNLLNISLDNEKHYTAFQMIINVPAGMTLGKATIDGMRSAGHQIAVRNLGNRQYLMAGFSSNNDELMGNSGRLLSVVTDGQATGDILISDIELVTTQAETYRLADIAISSTPTGIQSASLPMQKANEAYDLQGRRVINPTKGLYIVNGKKVNLK